MQDLLDQQKPDPAYQPTHSWTRGVQFVLAGGVLGTLAAVNEEVERSHLANISLILVVIFLLHSATYRSIPSGAIILLQLSTATLLSLAFMAVRGVGLNINTLPVQAVGVGIGVDYAIYIVDRIRQEVANTDGDIDEAIRRAIRTTGMAVTFTATTVVGGIFFWTFSNLRFQAEMARLLTVLMAINMLGAITIVPAFYSILRPRAATPAARPTQRHRHRPRRAPPPPSRRGARDGLGGGQEQGDLEAGRLDVAGGDLAAELRDQRLHQGETDAGALALARHLVLDPVEGLEDARELLGGDPGAEVAHRETERAPLPPRSAGRCASPRRRVRT